MGATKVADALVCTEGSCVQVAGAEQAYIQAEIPGAETRVRLPPEGRPEWRRKNFHRVCKPACRLLLALFGHSGVVALWAEEQDTHCRAGVVTPVWA